MWRDWGDTAGRCPGGHQIHSTSQKQNYSQSFTYTCTTTNWSSWRSWTLNKFVKIYKKTIYLYRIQAANGLLKIFIKLWWNWLAVLQITKPQVIQCKKCQTKNCNNKLEVIVWFNWSQQYCSNKHFYF